VLAVCGPQYQTRCHRATQFQATLRAREATWKKRRLLVTVLKNIELPEKYLLFTRETSYFPLEVQWGIVAREWRGEL